MTPAFERLMADATRLTRAGDLRAATAAIQAALRGAAPAATPVHDDAFVVDVDAREVMDSREVEDPREVDVERPVETPVPPLRDPAPDAGRFIAGRHSGAAGTRDYKLYVPPGHGAQALPLVVMLHGCTQDPDDFAAGTRMNEAALERGFFVLYPAQAQNANASRCWNWFKHNHQRRGRGEPALLADMTREVVERHGIDPRRVYVAGLSAGGAMAAILGDAYPDVYAAVGVHSGLPPGSATNVKTAFDAMKRGATAPAPSNGAAPPTIVFHGDRDTTVHPVNGEQVAAARGGASAPERERRNGGNGRDCTRHVYRDASGRVVAEHWVVHGAGHAWSGGSPRGSYTDVQGPDATEEMLRFFFAHELGQGG
jgi:poly(hydroxyalkanoate) depolymerase family esterase